MISSMLDHLAAPFAYGQALTQGTSLAEAASLGLLSTDWSFHRLNQGLNADEGSP
jgi:hypothetical protein